MEATRPLIKPCQITDELYWIGVNSAAPAHLIKTDEGLVLIDTGSYDTVNTLIDNITSLGFDVRDVRHIIHSHGHFDHIGATTKIVAMSGAKTYIGVGDVDAVRGKNEMLWALRTPPENRDEFYFEPDVIIRDGDKFKFGNLEMRFIESPGHTAGVLSIFWTVHYKGNEYVAGMFGGAGYGSLKSEYLDKFSLPYSLREDYVKSVNRLLTEQVDVHIGNHPANNKHEDKAARMTADYNPFVEEKTWIPFLIAQRDGLIKKFEM